MKLLRFKILILLLVFTAIVIKAEKLPYELREERRYTAEVMLPVDINKDGIDELVSFTHYNIALLDQKGNFIKDYYFPLESLKVKKYLSVCDYNEDGKKELFVMSEKDLTITVDCYNQTDYRKPLKHSIGWTVPYRNKNKKWFGEIIATKGIDVNDDGKFDVLFNIYTGGDTILRGVVVLDVETGKEMWHYWLGPQVYNIILEDLNNDDRPEIILGTYSPSNGNQANNTVDWESYVIVLDREGNLLWQKKISEYFSEALIAVSDIDLDGYKEIISASSTRRVDSIPDILWILDGVSGVEKKSISVGENIWGLVCADLNNDRKDEILTGNSDGTIRVFNTSLKQIKTHQNNNGIELISVCDLNGDGSKEIITTTEGNELIVFDRKLKQIAQMQVAHTLLHRIFSINLQNVWLIKDQKQTKLLILNPKEQQNEFILYEFYKIPFLSRRIPVLTVIIGAMLLLLLFGIGMVYTRYTKTRDIRTVIRGLTGKSGVIEINRKGETVTISPRAREILKIDDKDIKQTIKKLSEIKQIHPIIELAKSMITDSALPSPQETAISMSQERSYLVRCIRVKKGILITFEDISAVEYMKRVTSWTPVAQKLAHGIKNPLSTILGAVEQMEIKCEQNGVKKYIGYVKDEVTKLKKMSDAFMRFTKSAPAILEPKNINEIIKKIMAKYEPLWERGERNEKGGDIKVEYEVDEKLPMLNIDEEGISNALNIIIENAIEAMTPSPLSSPIEGEERSRSSPVKNEGKKREGILRIRTIPEERLEKEELKQYVRIEISDTGTGIPEKYLEKVFDPYFTYNKPLGTGLGLTLAKKIIEDHKGHIEINSKEGVGTQVNIYLSLK